MGSGNSYKRWYVSARVLEIASDKIIILITIIIMMINVIIGKIIPYKKNQIIDVGESVFLKMSTILE